MILNNLVPENEMEARYLRERQNDLRTMGNLYLALFGCLIGTIAASIFARIYVSFASSLASLIRVALFVSIFALACGIGYAVVLFFLAKYQRDFKIAAIAYAIAEGLSFLKSFSSDWSTLISLVVAGLQIFYIMKFCDGMMASFDTVDLVMSGTWQTFKKWYLYMLYATLVVTAAMILPFLGLFALIGAFVLAVGAIVLSIWQLILLYGSGKRMKELSTKNTF